MDARRFNVPALEDALLSPSTYEAMVPLQERIVRSSVEFVDTQEELDLYKRCRLLASSPKWFITPYGRSFRLTDMITASNRIDVDHSQISSWEAESPENMHNYRFVGWGGDPVNWSSRYPFNSRDITPSELSSQIVSKERENVNILDQLIENMHSIGAMPEAGELRDDAVIIGDSIIIPSPSGRGFLYLFNKALRNRPRPPHPDLYDALRELYEVQEDARKEGFPVPDYPAIEVCRRLLEDMYRISPRRYEVYPTPEGEIAIEGSGSQEQWLLFFYELSGGVLCISGGPGRDDRYKRYPSADRLPDAFLRQALRRLSDDGTQTTRG